MSSHPKGFNPVTFNPLESGIARYYHSIQELLFDCLFNVLLSII